MGLVGKDVIEDCCIDGNWAKCLLDSGSQVTLIYESFFRRLNKPLFPLQDLVLWHGGGGKIPYLGWTNATIGFDPAFCGTSQSSSTLALVVPDCRDATPYQVVVGTNSGAFRSCYQRLVDHQKGKDWKGSVISAACRRIYEDFEVSQRAGPAGKVGLVTCRSRDQVTVPANSQKYVSGTVRNGLGRPVTALLDAPYPRRMPTGMNTVCSLSHIGTGFQRVKVCLQNQTDVDLHLPRNCVLAEASLPVSVSGMQPSLKGGPGPSVAASTRMSTAGTTAGTNSTHVQQASRISEKEFGKLPFVWGPIDAKRRDRILKLAYSRSEIFSCHEWDVGLTKEINHEIKLTDETPFRERSRRVAPSDLRDLRDHLQHLLDIGVITESKSQYASPIVIVRKKNGQMRLCVDYRTLNSRTIPDQYVVPLVQEALDCLHGCRWFSVIDLKSGYYQIPMKPTDKDKTAFICPAGFYQFERMPQGVKGAPATFQRLMERCMAGLNLAEVLVYMDDVIVFAPTLDEMEKRLAKVFDRLAKFGLKIAPEKCQLCCTSVRYLGHIVSEEGVRTDPQKEEAIRSWPSPADARQLRSFLGLAGYYRRFIDGYAKIAKPLHELVAMLQSKGCSRQQTRGKDVTRGLKVTFAQQWTPKCQQAF